MSAVARDQDAWWYIRIHDTTAELVEAGNRLAVRRHTPPTLDSGTWACFQPSPIWYIVDDQGGMVQGRRNGYVGTLRLSREAATSEIVAHECVHCAVAIYRRRFAEQVDLGTDCGEPEERLAYIIGRTMRTVTNALHGMGVW